jgi:predicted HTH transcriptional regulator
MSDAEKMARLCTDLDRRSLVVEYDLSKPIAENMREAAALIRRLQAENEDFLEQLAIRSESEMAKDMQEIMKANSALHNENARLKQLVDFADTLRAENVALREREVT